MRSFARCGSVHINIVQYLEVKLVLQISILYNEHRNNCSYKKKLNNVCFVQKKNTLQYILRNSSLSAKKRAKYLTTHQKKSK